MFSLVLLCDVSSRDPLVAVDVEEKMSSKPMQTILESDLPGEIENTISTNDSIKLEKSSHMGEECKINKNKELTTHGREKYENEILITFAQNFVKI